MSIKVVRYHSDLKEVWNSFLEKCKNKHFMFFRDYMEYHSNRFVDFSLLFYDEKGNVVSIFPANLSDNLLYSHQGLTFGGVIFKDEIRMETMLDVMKALVEYSKEKLITKIIYKAIPYIYHELPAGEDLYALFLINARLTRRDITSTICLRKRVGYSKGRKWSINKAKKECLEFRELSKPDELWTLLGSVLEKQHGAVPVHSLEEILYLSSLFTENIKFYGAYKDNELIAGAVLFVESNIIHTQYLASSDVGRQLGALDFLIDWLITKTYENKEYFDFGISTEKNGRYLNIGLINQKEGFGARGVAHDFYEIDIV